MNTQGILFIALASGIYLFSGVTANQEPLPDVTYEDIEHLNAACPEADNCTEDRDNDNLDFYNCNCGEFCVQYGTCCVDSKYRVKTPDITRPYKCVAIYGTSRKVFMMDRCDVSWDGDRYTEELCKASAEEQDDLFLAAPVTNRKTGVTYKNYYCAICNKETSREQLTFWHMSLESLAEDIMDSPLPDIHFISSAKAWIVGEEIYDLVNDRVTPVAIVPDDIKDVIHDCVSDVISDCADNWTDSSVKYNCDAYTAVVRIGGNDIRTVRKYRNPHCAVCNFESFERKVCPRRGGIDMPQTLVPSNTFFVRLFSLYDKESKCDDDRVYDTIAKKCRKVYKG